jgi:hypothetical protein
MRALSGLRAGRAASPRPSACVVPTQSAFVQITPSASTGHTPCTASDNVVAETADTEGADDVEVLPAATRMSGACDISIEPNSTAVVSNTAANRVRKTSISNLMTVSCGWVGVANVRPPQHGYRNPRANPADII